MSLQDLKNIYHKCVALIAQIYYGFPGRRIRIIAITGTDGKTTTSSFIYHALKSSGKKVSVITTVGATINDKSYDTGFHVTTPNSIDLCRYISKSVANGDEYLVLEVTSHSISQHRVWGLRFWRSGITNITHEHLDYHGSWEHYATTKLRIADQSDMTYLNADESDVIALAKSLGKQAYKTYGFGPDSELNVDLSSKYQFYLEPYNKYNFLLAYAILRDVGLDDVAIGSALNTYVFPPGRMQVLVNSKFTVISDFAHTPNAIEQALIAISQKYPDRPIVHIFGCAAKRDVYKRTPMGEISAKYSSKVIVTEEDYRDEDPGQIAKQIASGLESGGFTRQDIASYRDADIKTYFVITDRVEAVTTAVHGARPSEVILITGKGHEKTLCRGTTEVPYNEAQVVAAAVG